MEMVAAESIGVGEDLTPPLSPISYSLHDSFIHSHCASCFSPLPNPHHHHPLLYCSPSCSSSHSPLHISSAAHLLPSTLTLESSDLRAALLLLLQIKRPFKSPHRVFGLMSNRHNLVTSAIDDDLSTRIKIGARTLAEATSAVDFRSEFLLEEAVLCAVLTNAVEVQDKIGRSVGIAVYDTSFSWINHSCSPNACYRFLPPETETSDQRCLIAPSCSEPVDHSDLLTGSTGGPRIVVRSIKTINKGDPVTISYTDLLQPKELRQSELWCKYRFTCCCNRCVAVPLTYVDQRLQETCGSNSEFLTEYIDDAINDYLSSNDAESCCKKLEDALSNRKIRLHPQNNLCLNAYTTLASAYSSVSATADGLKLKRFSVAYSLLLALLTHDLYLNESSLIVSVSNFWIGAGESLINLATHLASSGSSVLVLMCECGLIDVFEEGNFEVLKERVFKCLSEVIRGGNVWKFLVVGNGYLEVVKDLLDLRWFGLKTVAENGSSVSDVCDYQDVYRLGAHCLLYGGILSNISGGHNSHLSCYVRRLLCELSIIKYDERG